MSTLSCSILVRRLLQGLGIPMSAGLFIGLLTGKLRYGQLTLEWPQLLATNSHPFVEVLLGSLPGLVLFIACLALGALRHSVNLLCAFVITSAISAYCCALLFAQAFGNTWAAGEVFRELYLAQLPLLAMALLPGLLIALWLQPSSRPAAF